MTEILAKVFRGVTLESVHRGHLIVIDGYGETIAKMGDPDTVTFWRSAAKIFQVIPFIISGAADTHGFSEKEIALACASHAGETFHTDLAAQMLEKVGLSEEDLRCGAHASFHEQTAEAMIEKGEKPTQLNNNCSGKHSAMLAFAKHIGADLDSYLALDSPVQQAILEVVSEFTGVAKEEIKIGIDGCSAPNFAVPISSMAKAFLKLIDPPQQSDRDVMESGNIISLSEACERIIAAQIKYPEYVGGSVRLDTRIMKALEEKLICKVGAEGVWCAAVLPSAAWKKGLAIALKIEDGDNGRAREVVAVELLKQLGIMDERASEQLKDFSPIILKNRNDIEVGKVLADFEI